MDRETWVRLIVGYFAPDYQRQAETTKQIVRIMDRTFDLDDMAFTEELLVFAKRRLRSTMSASRVRKAIGEHSHQVQRMNDDLEAEA